MLLCIWCGLIVSTIVGLTDKNFLNFKSSGKSESDSSAAERLTQLEKRLTDIQDIVITIDEKLSRIERQPAEPSKNDSE
ncbi:MAG: hypothetical protein QGG64_14410 [Candidatus Latescibacteria bacterium]|nr:hypothetical protein [Candidatus Latescibacterota bacterium]